MLGKIITQLRISNSYQVYSYLLAILLVASAVILFILAKEVTLGIKIIGSTLFLFAFLIITFVVHFLKITPYSRGIIFSIITVVISVLSLVIFSNIFPKASFHTTGPIVIFVQYIVAKLILRLVS